MLLVLDKPQVQNHQGLFFYTHGSPNQAKHKPPSANINARSRLDGKTTPSPDTCQLRVISLNARSTVNKIDSFEVLLFSYDPHLLVISETWLQSGILDEEIVPQDYVIYRRDRGSRGGGVAVIAKRVVNVTLLEQIDQHESLFLHVTAHGFTFFLCAVYHAPDAADSFMYSLFDRLLPYQNRNLIITGDFNFPAIDWDKRYYGLSASCNIILGLMFSLNLKQTVHAYTRETSVLDLFFVSQTFFDGVLSVQAGISGHRQLFFCCVSPVVCRMHPVKMIKDCTRADDSAIIDSLQSQLDDPCSDDLDSLWQHFKNTVQYNIEHFVPLRKVRINRRNRWISREIIQMKRKVKRCRKKKIPCPQQF